MDYIRSCHNRNGTTCRMPPLLQKNFRLCVGIGVERRPMVALNSKNSKNSRKYIVVKQLKLKPDSAFQGCEAFFSSLAHACAIFSKHSGIYFYFYFCCIKNCWNTIFCIKKLISFSGGVVCVKKRLEERLIRIWMF